MDACLLSMCSRVRRGLFRLGGVGVFAAYGAVSITLMLTACGNTGTLLSSVGGGSGSVIDPIDLSGAGSATCTTSYRNNDQGFGFELDVLGVEAAGQTPNADALFANAWTFTVDGVGVTVAAEVHTTDFPANLALIVATADADITAAGGNVRSTFELVLANGDQANQSNYVLDGVLAYRVDVVKNEKRYTLSASATQADVTQQVDNALTAAVTSLCVD